MPLPLRRVLQLALTDCGVLPGGPGDDVDTSGLPQAATDALTRIVRKNARATSNSLQELLDAYGVDDMDEPLPDITPQEVAAATVVVDTVTRNALHIGIVQARDVGDVRGFWVARSMEFPSVWLSAAAAVGGASPADMFGSAGYDFVAQPWAAAARRAADPVFRYLRGLYAYCFMQRRILSAALPSAATAPLERLSEACRWLLFEGAGVFDDAATLDDVARAVDRYTGKVQALTAVATHRRDDGVVTVTQTYNELRRAWRALSGMTRLTRMHAGVMFVVRAKLRHENDARGVALLDRTFGAQWSRYLYTLRSVNASNPTHALRNASVSAYTLAPLRAMHAGYARLTADDAAPQVPTPVQAANAWMDAHDGDVPAQDVTLYRLAAASPLLLTTLLPRGDALPPDALFEFDTLESVRLADPPATPVELRPLFRMLPRANELWACLDGVLMRCRTAALQGVQQFEGAVNTDGMDEPARRALLKAYCKQHGMPYPLLRDLDAQQRGVAVDVGARDDE